MANDYLTPKPQLIRSRVNRDWTPHKAIAEFVDNSLGPNKGGAHEVYVEFGPGYIEVTDHGRGCDDINRMFCLGDSSSFEDRRDIGLYGVGATDVVTFLLVAVLLSVTSLAASYLPARRAARVDPTVTLRQE